MKNVGWRRRAVGRNVVIVGLVVVALAACVPGGESRGADAEPAGFLMGVWHGWIAPISLIGGAFNPAIRVYDRNNTGWWYDFGFYIAIIAGFGQISLARRKAESERRKRHDEN